MESEIQKEPSGLLRAEYMRDMGRHRKPDERRDHDTDIRRDSLPDLGAGECAGLYRVWLCRAEDSQGPRSLRIEDHEMDLRNHVCVPGMAEHERNTVGIRRHSARARLWHVCRLPDGCCLPHHSSEIWHDPERSDGRLRMDYRVSAGPDCYGGCRDPQPREFQPDPNDRG